MGEFITSEKFDELMKQFPDQSPQGLDDAMQDLIDAGHEIEGFNAEFSPIDAVKNIPESGKEFVKSIYHAITNPLQTIQGITDTARGAVLKLDDAIFEAARGRTRTSDLAQSGTEEGGKEAATRAQQIDAFDNVIDFFAGRYGSMDKFKETIERDPVGFLSDATAVLSGGAGVAKGATGVAGKALAKTGGKQLAIPGAVSTGTGKVSTALTKTSQTAGKVQKFARSLEPTTLAIKTARRVNELSGVNKLMRSFSAKLTGDAIAITPSTRKNIQGTTKTSGDPVRFLNRHGISGSLDSMKKQLVTVADRTRVKVDQLLDTVPGELRPRNAESLLAQMDKLFRKGKNNAIKDNLSDHSLQTLGEIEDLTLKFKKTGLTVSELNRVKRLSDEVLDIFKLSGDPKATFRFKDQAAARQGVREVIERHSASHGIRDIRELNQQTSMAKQLEKVIDERIVKGKGLSPWIDRASGIIMGGGLTTVAFSGELFAPLVGTAAALGTLEVFRFPKVRTFVANRLRLMADGEFAELQRGIETGKFSSKATRTMRQIRRDIQKAFPELNIVEQSQDQEQ